MGTRYEDQPAEHWAGPESLDPTPVWKQYVLIALLLVVGLVIIVAVGLTALAPEIVTPPSMVFGDRLVLAATDIPAPGAPPRRFSAPVVDDAHAFYLIQPEKGTVFAFRARWRPRATEPECRVVGATPIGFTAMDCAVFAPGDPPTFDRRGAPLNRAAVRGLDQYLVSMSGDRVIVNLSRLIESSERTSAPVPTGIPQPQATP
ncbi:MAG: hypothetical protein E6I57_10095 [Chloroflexi bacterium]|nr:MAG: hypothetical protein E6J24_03280 [Chloroflexota bacterium]TME38076.1 MAG: hypothetical protein E6I57_10095 [Chloroflexota bacterium]